jgi:hypothetical protein
MLQNHVLQCRSWLGNLLGTPMKRDSTQNFGRRSLSIVILEDLYFKLFVWLFGKWV